MQTWLMMLLYSALFLLVGTALFFFTLTRGALLLRYATGKTQHDAAHVYPIYANMKLIKLIDFQPLIGAILLFQYDRLVNTIVAELEQMDLKEKRVLITSCAFGNVIPLVAQAASAQGVKTLLIADIIQNELINAQGKLKDFSGEIIYSEENAIAMKQADASVSANVIFFLLHELPHHLKTQALQEAVRVLEPGGKLFLAEFHRPDPWALRALSWTYFKVFEPYGLALWSTHDPLHQLCAMRGISCQRKTVFFGNFQVIVATKQALVT
ncbi:MAG: class I SAM-dependent methyltransferase [Burkholderiales bacterium]|jgi:ubiquinone/menaquinone biosynthesis C-methylase UbiE|nr:class I SAM-dependent methyltransferase [Burkholderiales bacterium]